MATMGGETNLTKLPREILDMILALVDPTQLAAVSQTCHQLYAYVTADRIWQPIVQRNVPGTKLTSPSPFTSFYELYAAHDPYWFLTRFKMWCSGHDLTGKIIMARFNPVNGYIEGYRLLPVQQPADDDAGNTPGVNRARFVLSKELPVLMLPPRRWPQPDLPSSEDDLAHYDSKSHFGRPRPAQPPALRDVLIEGVQANGAEPAPHAPVVLQRSLIFATPLSRADEEALQRDGPAWYEAVWPTMEMPSPHRVVPGRTLRIEAASELVPPLATLQQYPRCRAELSEYAVYMRTWLQAPPGSREMARMTRPVESVPASAAAPEAGAAQATTAASAGLAQRPGQRSSTAGSLFDLQPRRRLARNTEFDTLATIDPFYYTPTADKPFRGIYVADYTVHGFEMVLVHQPDDDSNAPNWEEAVGPQLPGEPDKTYARRRHEGRIYRGSMVAVKLTGDPNVPRGEVTFQAQDLSLVDDSTVSLGSLAGSPLDGQRRIPSQGHVADTGFRNDHFLDCRLFLLSGDRLAQYWIPYDHVIYYHRVDMDAFVDPKM